MKFTLNSKQLYNKLQNASKVIKGKNTLPILDCFLFGLRGNTLHIAATDGEIRLVTKVDVEEANGDTKIAIDAKTITDALKELPEQPITFEVNEDNLEVLINYHNGKFNFVGKSAEEYPAPKNIDDKHKQAFSIESNVLFDAINGTLFASADDELRPCVNGVYFDVTKDNVTFVASDGYKLTKLVSIETKGLERGSFILPKKSASVLKNLLAKEDSNVAVTFDLNQARFKLSDYDVTVRFIEGRYPNYDSVIPTSYQSRISLSKSTLTTALKRVSVLGNKETSLVKLDFTDNSLKVSAQDIDFSTAAEEDIPCSVDGETMTIGFKSSFLIELLDSINSEEVELFLTSPTKAGVIKPCVNSFGFEQTTLLMPMVLNN